MITIDYNITLPNTEQQMNHPFKKKDSPTGCTIATYECITIYVFLIIFQAMNQDNYFQGSQNLQKSKTNVAVILLQFDDRCVWKLRDSEVL